MGHVTSLSNKSLPEVLLAAVFPSDVTQSAVSPVDFLVDLLLRFSSAYAWRVIRRDGVSSSS